MNVRDPRRSVIASFGRSARDWWIPALFAIGATLFALGAVPWYAQAVGVTPTAVTFLVGSVFFTSAATLQYLEAVDALPSSARRFVAWAPGHLDWLAGAVQLAGTLWFNWSTANAVRINLTAATEDHRVWRPDALGSMAFLIASGVAWWAVRRGGPRDVGSRLPWWIALANMVGSVASASPPRCFVIPATGDVSGRLAGQPRHPRRCPLLPGRCGVAAAGLGRGPG